MPTITISLVLTFATPPSVGAGGASGTLADKVVARNAHGEFIIPASQVKGKLRQACEQLLRGRVPLCHPPRAEQMCPQIEKDDAENALPQKDGLPCCVLCQVFGSPGYPSRLRFHDLVVTDADLLPPETLRPMVSLNRRRRVAEAQRLFLIETAPHFNGLQFQNSEAITGQVGQPSHIHIVLAGLQLLFAWGGGTSRGLGWGDVKWEAWLDGQLINKIDSEEVKQICLS
jgi:CRISPR/Cas system CSM-associated protein Csm3 (group 7 of RAMP superfamily)